MGRSFFWWSWQNAICIVKLSAATFVVVPPGRFERPTPALGVLTECKQQEIADNNKSAIHTWTPLAEYSREEKK